jgi:hypothetical protein
MAWRASKSRRIGLFRQTRCESPAAASCTIDIRIFQIALQAIFRPGPKEIQTGGFSGGLPAWACFRFVLFCFSQLAPAVSRMCPNPVKARLRRDAPFRVVSSLPNDVHGWTQAVCLHRGACGIYVIRLAGLVRICAVNESIAAEP